MAFSSCSPHRAPSLGQLSACLVLSVLLGACGRPESGGPIASRELGILITSLPPGLTLEPSSADRLVFRTLLGLPGTAGTDQLTIRVAAAPDIALIGAVREQRADFEALPGGLYFGSRQETTGRGTAYSVRGRFALGGVEVEEARLVAPHPDGRRRLTLACRYLPGDDGAAQRELLLAVYAGLELLPDASP